MGIRTKRYPSHRVWFRIVMVKKLFRNKGGLHNRVTARIPLNPFSLGVCERYVRERGIEMTRRDIAECYMAIGGIPYYWRHLVRGYSLAQNFNRMFFAEGAPLKNEFHELYASLFRNAPIYMRIVGALAKKKVGMTRDEITDATGMTDSGQVSDALDTLSESGFIRRYRSYGKNKRGGLYQLIDNFTLFHFRFLGNATSDERFWTDTLSSTRQSAWRGLAFERLCLQHLEQIRKALGIAGVHTEAYAWRHVGNDVHPQGVQIDLLLDRADNVINICEMKFAQGPFVIDKATAGELSVKAETFRAVSRTRKAIHLTMVTSEGLVRNAYNNRIQSDITLDDLFAD